MIRSLTPSAMADRGGRGIRSLPDSAICGTYIFHSRRKDNRQLPRVIFPIRDGRVFLSEFDEAGGGIPGRSADPAGLAEHTSCFVLCADPSGSRPSDFFPYYRRESGNDPERPFDQEQVQEYQYSFNPGVTGIHGSLHEISFCSVYLNYRRAGERP
jgi:hypothetical protein